jgi:RNA polymerase sigma-70 factor (ECF subfamily)
LGGRTTSEDALFGRDAFLSRIQVIMEPAYRLATVMLRDHGAAEEAVHRAALQAWERYQRVSGQVTSFRTWFLAVVAHECRRTRLTYWLRRPSRRSPVIASAAGANRLPGAILRLRSRDRAALFCFYSLDLPMDDVARVLGVSTAAARSRVYRAGRRLRLEGPEGY